MKQKSKFNKDMCKTCKFHGRITGIDTGSVFCNYASLNDETCLHRKGSRVIDRRGNNYDKCKLYEEGNQMRDSSNWQENNMSGMRNLGGRYEDRVSKGGL